MRSDKSRMYALSGIVYMNLIWQSVAYYPIIKAKQYGALDRALRTITILWKKSRISFINILHVIEEVT